MKKILTALMIFLIICGITNGNLAVLGNTEEISEGYSEISIEDDFDEKSVLVILDKSISGINKIHDNTTFSKISYSEIEDLTYVNDITTIKDVNNFEQILQIYLLEPGKENVISLIEQLKVIPGVRYAGPNSYFKTEQVPNDSLYDPNVSLVETQWAHSNTDIEEAWDFTTGSKEIRIGVIDSGVNQHPDLDVNVEEGLDFVYMLDNKTPGDLREDVDGHGTHVAGIIGAVGNNGIGVSGVNWNISIVPMQISDESAVISIAACVKAINYARDTWNTEERISVLSMSLGGSDPIEEIEVAIREYEGLFVCSTGNDKQNNDLVKDYPSFYASSLHTNPIENMITVGRIDINNEKPINANWGENTISIFSPGQNILSTFPEHLCENHDEVFYDGTKMCEIDKTFRDEWLQQIEAGEYTWNQILNEFYLMYGRSPREFTSSVHHSDGYHYMSGSSMSTPYVSGVAALLLSIKEDLTTQQLKAAILNSAETITITLPDNSTQNVKKLNAYNAVKYVLENYVSTPHTLSSRVSMIDTNKTIVGGEAYFNEKNALYKLNLTESKNYEFKMSSNSEIELMLYDQNFNEIECIDLNSHSNQIHVIKMLSSGRYYLRTKFVNEESSGTINTKIVYATNYGVTLGNNDILLNTYNYNAGINESNVYSIHISETEFGFYKFELVGYTNLGNQIEYPNASIVIKDSEQNIIARIEYDGYVSQASNEENENSFVVSLKEEGYIYIYIEIDTSDLNSLYLNINPVKFEAIDLFDMYDSFSEQINIIENESTYGDYFKKITINQSARFFVELSNFSNLDDKVLFILSKLNYNSSTDSYSLENIVMELMPYDEREFTYVLDLAKGIYFVGYFNKDDNSIFNLRFTRIVSEFSTTKLVSDPDSLSLYGSEVRHNGGNLGGNTLTVGFTRILYIDYNSIVPSYSISNYDLCVSDSSIATVSVYGTMLALRSGTVNVVAIYKNNPSIIYSKTFEVLEETRDDDLIINIDTEVGYSEVGQLYQISLNDLNCPYPQNTLYGWSVVQSDYDLSISMYGSIRLMGEDEIIIEGRYSLNRKVVIRLTLTVV